MDYGSVYVFAVMCFEHDRYFIGWGASGRQERVR